MDQTNFPKAGWEIVLKDHDGGAQWGDDLYDISPDGDSKVPQIFHSLWEIAHPGSLNAEHNGEGGGTGESANLTAAINTGAPMCAIEAASSVDDGTILFTESEFTNDCDPPDGYEVPGAPDCPVGDDGQCFEY